MRRSLAALLAAGALAGCGSQEAPDIPIERDARAVTAPGSGIPYENGGADGSGADGNSGTRDREPRGGVAAGPDASGEGRR